jgi:hypothetical protein
MAQITQTIEDGIVYFVFKSSNDEVFVHMVHEDQMPVGKGTTLKEAIQNAKMILSRITI